MNQSLGVPTVDCAVLTRDKAPLRSAVLAGITAQRGVRMILHRVVGGRQKGDKGRLEAIARGRNEGKRRGTSPWLMFLDDDVVLAPDCVLTLLQGLLARPLFAALAADYLQESRGRISTPHVAMGATLFRRHALGSIQFHCDEKRCECGYCCADLRRRQWGIGYLPGARALHLSGHYGLQKQIVPARSDARFNRQPSTPGPTLQAGGSSASGPRSQFRHR